MQHDIPIAFVGAGNMTHCLISGLIANRYQPHYISVSDLHQERLDLFKTEFDIESFTDNKSACKNAQIIILAVKPQNLKPVVSELSDIIQAQKPLVISIAAGIPIRKIAEWLSNDCAIVRCMPNIAAFVQSGATGMYANSHVTPLQHDLAENIMRAVGVTLWVNNEKLIDVVSAISGSGPAYFFLMMEALESVATEMGLTQEDARLLISQTALGAARLSLSAEESPANLRARVTSKGGTTERAIAILEEFKLREAFQKAIKAAYARSLELAEAF